MKLLCKFFGHKLINKYYHLPFVLEEYAREIGEHEGYEPMVAEYISCERCGYQPIIESNVTTT